MRETTFEMDKAIERKLSAYFKEMGVDQGVLEKMKRTSYLNIAPISQADMFTMNLITSYLGPMR